MKGNELAVIVHGGGGRISPKDGIKKLPGLKTAINTAWDSLCAGKPGIIAVVEALRVMEDSQYFNAGYGGYPNVNGIVLLDVGLMEGTGDFVSLVHVRKLKHPSSVALDMLKPGRTLFTSWTHELAMELEDKPDFIKERYGLVSSHEEMIAPYVKELMKHHEVLEVEQSGLGGGTVGCVVRDSSGEISSGTSTGGTGFKLNGRIGDSPIVGMGVFADSELCGLSTTGHGETFMKNCFSGFVLAEIRRELSSDNTVFEKRPDKLKKILTDELKEMSRKGPGTGGIILIPRCGAPQWAFNSEMISVGIKTGTCSKTASEEVFIAKADGSFEC